MSTPAADSVASLALRFQQTELTLPLTVEPRWLAQYLFESIAAVQDYATQWLWHYNNERPNMGLGGITPKQKLAIVA